MHRDQGSADKKNVPRRAPLSRPSSGPIDAAQYEVVDPFLSVSIIGQPKSLKARSVSTLLGTRVTTYNASVKVLFSSFPSRPSRGTARIREGANTETHYCFTADVRESSRKRAFT